MAKKRKKPNGPREWLRNHEPVQTGQTWFEALDDAVEAKFSRLRSSTHLTARGYRTRITMRDEAEVLRPRERGLVSAFIDGFMACERGY